MNTFLKLNLKTLNKYSLVFYIILLKKIFNKINLVFSIFNCPKKKKRLTFLKSPHVYKKAQQHFKLISYKCIIYIKQKVSIKLLKQIFFNKPKIVSLQLKLLRR